MQVLVTHLLNRNFYKWDVKRFHHERRRDNEHGLVSGSAWRTKFLQVNA